jgi:hypothetical protein
MNSTRCPNFQVVSLVGLRTHSALARTKRLPPYENQSLFVCRRLYNASRAPRLGGLKRTREQRQRLDSDGNHMRMFESGRYPKKPGRSFQTIIQRSARQQHVRALRYSRNQGV